MRKKVCGRWSLEAQSLSANTTHGKPSPYEPSSSRLTGPKRRYTGNKLKWDEQAASWVLVPASEWPLQKYLIQVALHRSPGREIFSAQWCKLLLMVTSCGIHPSLGWNEGCFSVWYTTCRGCDAQGLCPKYSQRCPVISVWKKSPCFGWVKAVDFHSWHQKSKPLCSFSFWDEIINIGF